MCSNILYRKSQFYYQHGKLQTISNAVSRLNPHIVHDLDSIRNMCRFVDPNLSFGQWTYITGVFLIPCIHQCMCLLIPHDLVLSARRWR